MKGVIVKYNSVIKALYLQLFNFCLNHSGNISITINTELVSSPISFSEEDCYNIYSLFYGENFETMEAVSDFCTTNIITAEIKEDETYGKFLESTANKDKNGTLKSIANLNIGNHSSPFIHFKPLTLLYIPR